MPRPNGINEPAILWYFATSLTAEVDGGPHTLAEEARCRHCNKQPAQVLFGQCRDSEVSRVCMYLRSARTRFRHKCMCSAMCGQHLTTSCSSNQVNIWKPTFMLKICSSRARHSFAVAFANLKLVRPATEPRGLGSRTSLWSGRGGLAAVFTEHSRAGRTPSNKRMICLQPLKNRRSCGYLQKISAASAANS